jgi:hypothetical protein
MTGDGRLDVYRVGAGIAKRFACRASNALAVCRACSAGVEKLKSGASSREGLGVDRGVIDDGVGREGK